ncbi:formin-binding protein 1-like, partial [Caerostris extrusa]
MPKPRRPEDQFDQISTHTLKGVEYCEKYSQLVKDVSAAENEHAAKLKKLVKHYQIKKKSDDTDLQFSTYRAFVLMLNEIKDMAGQHELISENLLNNVVHNISLLVKQIKEERKIV